MFWPRRLLREKGLRVTLLRIKVLQAMHLAHSEDTPLSLPKLLAHLADSGNPVSASPLRKVMFRLEDAGLLVQQPKGLWQLATPAKTQAEPGESE